MNKRVGLENISLSPDFEEWDRVWDDGVAVQSLFEKYVAGDFLDQDNLVTFVTGDQFLEASKYFWLSAVFMRGTRDCNLIMWSENKVPGFYDQDSQRVKILDSRYCTTQPGFAVNGFSTLKTALFQHLSSPDTKKTRDFKYLPAELCGTVVLLGTQNSEDKNVPENVVRVPWSEKIKFTKDLNELIKYQKSEGGDIDILISASDFSAVVKKITESMKSSGLSFEEVIRPFVERYNDEWVVGFWSEIEKQKAVADWEELQKKSEELAKIENEKNVEIEITKEVAVAEASENVPESGYGKKISSWYTFVAGKIITVVNSYYQKTKDVSVKILIKPAPKKFEPISYESRIIFEDQARNRVLATREDVENIIKILKE